MDDPLAIYLHDHLAGCGGPFGGNGDKHPREPLGDFAPKMLTEVEADRAVLRSLADRIGAGSSRLKELSAWLSEKISRFKLDRAPHGLGTFEALEFLALGVLGKLKLWKALGTVSSVDTRLQGVDFDHLAARAETQHAEVEKRRLEAAKMAMVRP